MHFVVSCAYFLWLSYGILRFAYQYFFSFYCLQGLLLKTSPSSGPTLPGASFLVNPLPSVIWAKLGRGHTEPGTVLSSWRTRLCRWQTANDIRICGGWSSRHQLLIVLFLFLCFPPPQYGRRYSKAACFSCSPTNPGLILLPPAVLQPDSAGWGQFWSW